MSAVRERIERRSEPPECHGHSRRTSGGLLQETSAPSYLSNGESSLSANGPSRSAASSSGAGAGPDWGAGAGSAAATGVGERAMRSKSDGARIFDEVAQRDGGCGWDRGCCAALERLGGALDEGRGCVEVICVDRTEEEREEEE